MEDSSAVEVDRNSALLTAGLPCEENSECVMNISTFAIRPRLMKFCPSIRLLDGVQFKQTMLFTQMQTKMHDEMLSTEKALV